MNAARFAWTIVIGVSGLAVAADWPQYKADASRSAYTPENLTFPLHRKWSYTPAQPPRPAWPDPGVERQRIGFDYAFHPVISNGMVYLGSSADDTLRAFNAATGKMVWAFTTGGPVRFAPAVANGRAYVASDDGSLYCLNAKTGELHWPFRAAIRDEQVLGNGRMISRWPARSGVLVVENTVYATAGMWPSEGVFVYALNAETGQVQWCNDTCGYMFRSLPHSSHGLSGVAPQGYLVAAGDVLLVPTGRSIPAGFDRRTGKLLHYNPSTGGGHSGGVEITVAGEFFYNPGEYGADISRYQIRTGKESGRGVKGHGILACKAGMVRRNGGKIYFYGHGRNGKKWTTNVFKACSLAVTGNAVIVGGADAVTALALDTGKVLWKGSVDGLARGLAVADGRLVVTTEQGELQAFEHTPNTPTSATDQIAPPLPKTEVRMSESWRSLVSRMKKECRAKGFALVIGEADLDSAVALAQQSDFNVIRLIGDRKRVTAERREVIAKTDLYGSRLAIQSHTGKQLPFPAWFANLIVVGKQADPLPIKELYRVLRPCGGVLWIGSPYGQRVSEAMRAAHIPDDEVRKEGSGWIVKRGKLPGSFDWDAKVSRDQLVKWPLELQWFGGPGSARTAAGRIPLPAHGLLFLDAAKHLVAIDAYNGSEWWSRPLGRGRELSANADDLYVHWKSISIRLDARTGTLKEYYGLKHGTQRFSLAAPHTVDVPIDDRHSAKVTIRQAKAGIELVLDSRDPVLTYPARKQKGNWGSVVDIWRGDTWELFFDFRKDADRFGLYAPGAFHLTVIPATKVKATPWVKKGDGPVHPEVTVTGKATDSGTTTTLLLPWSEISELVGEKPTAFAFGFRLQSCDGKHGVLPRFGKPEKVTWTSRFVDGYAHIFNNGWATFQLSPTVPGTVEPPPKFRQLVKSLDQLPAKMRKGRRPPYSLKKYWSPGRSRTMTRLNPLTQQKEAFTYAKSHGCGGASFSQTMAFFRTSTVGYYDLRDDSGLRNFGGQRPSCGISAIPALGMLLAPEGSGKCQCAYNYKTSFALAPARQQREEDWAVFPNLGSLKAPLRRAHINLGAPGDRRGKDKALWLSYPRPTSSKYAFQLPLTVEGYPQLHRYRFNAERTRIENTEKPWIYSSGYRGLKRATLVVNPVRCVVSLPTPKAPKIDAVLDDACWGDKQVVPFGGRDRVVIRHDAQNLYVAFKRPATFDRRGKQTPWLRKTKGADAEIWKDDAFEVFISDDAAKTSIHLGLSASGARYDARCLLEKDAPEDRGWNADWQGVAAANGKAFSVEILIPWKLLAAEGIQKETARVNIRTRGRQLQSPGTKGWSRCERFNPLGLGKPRSLQKRRFTVKLHFAEPDSSSKGARIFDIRLQGKVVQEGLDVADSSGGKFNALVKTFGGIQAADTLVVELLSQTDDVTPANAPILNGIEIVSEDK